MLILLRRKLRTHSVHPPPLPTLPVSAGGGLNLQPNFQKGGGA